MHVVSVPARGSTQQQAKRFNEPFQRVCNMALAHVRRRLRGNTAPKLWDTEGASTDEEAEAAAHYNNRGLCGQFVWPCPRAYPACPRARKSKNWLVPADLSKGEYGVPFKQVGTSLGHGPIMEEIHVFDEARKKYNKTIGVRERQRHLVFKMKALFGHEIPESIGWIWHLRPLLL